jgi:hypothetical protein
MHVSCSSHTRFIYNLNTIFYWHNIHTEGTCSHPFVTPFLSPAPPPFPHFLLAHQLTLFTYLEIPFLCCGANARPLLTLVGGKLNSLTLPTFPFPFNGPLKFMLHALLRRHYNIGCAQSDTIKVLIKLTTCAPDTPYAQYLLCCNGMCSYY